MREYALVLLVTAAVTYLLTPLVRRVAIRTHAIHAPRARDVHTTPTPLLGGLAMYGGLAAGLLIASRLSFLQDPFRAAGSRTQAGLLMAGGLIVVIGFVDDRWGLSAISKLAGQVAVGGILVWSGQALPWLPLPNGRVLSLEPDLSVTLTILLVVVTINAINFIDGLDGLAAGIGAVAALSFLAYSYTLVMSLKITSQSLPAVSSALLAGICIGFLPHNFYPARIFMGEIGASLVGLLLAYGPIASTDSLDPALLTHYGQNHTVNRFGTILPLLVTAAIFLIPYTDLMLAVIRRTRRGKPVMTADREHLHHRLLGVGHSYRQSVLIMWLWAALFSVTVVSLSLVRSHLVVLEAATIIAVLTLLPVTMPRLRPWRLLALLTRGRVQRRPLVVTPVAASAVPASTSPSSAVPSSAVPSSAVPGAYPSPVKSAASATHRGSGTHPGDGLHPGSGLQPGNGLHPGNGAIPVNGTLPTLPDMPDIPDMPVSPNVVRRGVGSALPGLPAVPGPGPAERALRPFPGDADRGYPPRYDPEPFPGNAGLSSSQPFRGGADRGGRPLYDPEPFPGDVDRNGQPLYDPESFPGDVDRNGQPLYDAEPFPAPDPFPSLDPYAGPASPRPDPRGH